ncbi:TPA: hypothetical protein PJH62_003154 [Acinetobacter nosocomialis]|jgi:hypothetical protein|uniref:hypothetical protein n=1 Tax=Acinetobacter TaxID=469 RepID=UPI0002AED324|nr:MULTISPECIES: hypothetical protein [Acinetobacter]ELW81951.1 hypothetical protein ACIN5021_2213 [Acinetobacter sp. OIFC021]EXE49029.1 hypothetical protein J576_2811 [Acinetobacter sp. 766875]MDE1667636.1 hypothetical protein [Acinetobacter nosocomialis]MDE9415071.1 hypothetical protein [Acinetobacter nosocomialis]MDV7449349.1 hypothetical protein [Acinetobacter baumannii]
MVIEFTQEHLDAFLDDREETLALWNWNRLKQLYSDLAEKNFGNDEVKGVQFLIVAQKRIRKYLNGMENNEDYNKWRAAYGEICFILNKNNIDEDPWNRSLLEERLWPPFLAIDILAGVLESSLNNSASQKFYASLESHKWE